MYIPSKAKALHLQRICAEVSSSAPHFLYNGLSISPIKCRYLLRLLCLVRRLVAALDCILLKDKNLILVTRQGHMIRQVQHCVLKAEKYCVYAGIGLYQKLTCRQLQGITVQYYRKLPLNFLNLPFIIHDLTLKFMNIETED
jgi:hypothetical protein